MKKYAIVLSGGGSKGAYQVGVWKALRKLWIRYDIVTGTSVGALNGILMVQKDYKKCLEIWENIDFSHLFQEEFPGKYSTLKEKSEIYKKYADGFFKEGGMDIKRLEELVKNAYDEKKFYHSSIDYGLITYNLSRLKPISLTKQEIPKELVMDYVIASATCFPAFKTKEINGEKYIDGGYYDNVPLNLAVKMGAKAIIAIDLDEVGIKKPISNPDIPVIKIMPRNSLGSFLIFNKEIAKEAIQFGYNDTMKTFGKLDGNLYTFKRKHLKKNANKYLEPFVIKAQSIIDTAKDSFLDSILKSSDFIKLHKNQNTIDIMNETIEYLGIVLNIKQSPIYDIKTYNYNLKTIIEQEPTINITTILEKVKKKEIKDIIHLKTVVKYFYQILQKQEVSEKEKKDIITIAYLFPKELLGAIYLTILN